MPARKGLLGPNSLPAASFRPSAFPCRRKETAASERRRPAHAPQDFRKKKAMCGLASSHSVCQLQNKTLITFAGRRGEEEHPETVLRREGYRLYETHERI